MSKPISVLLDTDIGDDLDDAFCLALMLRSPELSVRSVTAVFNDTVARCTMIAEMCEAAGQKPRIVAGLGGIMSPRPLSWGSGRQMHYESKKPRFDGPGPEHLIEAWMTARREYDAIFTIGPLTNLAASLLADPNVKRMPRVMMMAGEFQHFGMAEYNIRCDVEAAALCFQAGFPIDLIPWTIGIKTKLHEADRNRIRQANTPLGRVLADYMNQFHVFEPQRADMFDPMTVVALLKPELFRWERGFVTVETRGEQTYGQTLFRRDPNGPHRWASDVDAEAAKTFMLDRLT